MDDDIYTRKDKVQKTEEIQVVKTVQKVEEKIDTKEEPPKEKETFNAALEAIKRMKGKYPQIILIKLQHNNKAKNNR